jgi:ElaB/YqjD/DUF883 family membrane-anchored ribosome-binding protein
MNTHDAIPEFAKPDAFMHGLRQLLTEADRLCQDAARTGSHAYTAAQDDVQELVQRMRDRLDDLERTASRKARRVADRTDRTVHDHPYAFIGAAAAVGALVGYLGTRRR